MSNENDPELSPQQIEQIAEDDLFDLPESITQEPRLRRLHAVMITCYLREISHLTLTFQAKMLVERICLYYIVMRENERTLGYGPAAYGNAVQEKAFKQHWLLLVQEFNKMVQASDVKKHEEMLQNVSRTIITILNGVSDEELRDKLVSRIANAFDELGI